MSNPKMKLSDAYELAQQVLITIAGYCTQARIAGSIRRGTKAYVGDIEIVAIPQAARRDQTTFGGAVAADGLDAFLQGLEVGGEITRHISADPRQICWGPRHKKFKLVSGDGNHWLSIMVDLYVVKPPAQWGAIYALRTGPADFNQAIMSQVLPRRRLQHLDGRLLTPDGNPLSTPTERDYFQALGLPCLRPDRRCVEAIRWCIEQGKVQPYVHSGPALPVQAALF